MGIWTKYVKLCSLHGYVLSFNGFLIYSVVPKIILRFKCLFFKIGKISEDNYNIFVICDILRYKTRVAQDIPDYKYAKNIFQYFSNFDKYASKSQKCFLDCTVWTGFACIRGEGVFFTNFFQTPVTYVSSILSRDFFTTNEQESIFYKYVHRKKYNSRELLQNGRQK
jgi:hypothetical protein